MRPIKALRLFLQKHPDTEPLSSQLGLAQLVDRSESLVRAIEGGRLEMSRKFAKALSDKTGASKNWLMLPNVDSDEVPSLHGGALRHEEVVARIKAEIEGHLKSAETDLLSARLRGDPGEQTRTSVGNIQSRMAAVMGKLVEDALLESLSRGDTRLMDEITRVLAKDLPAEKPASEAPRFGD